MEKWLAPHEEYPDIYTLDTIKKSLSDGMEKGFLKTRDKLVVYVCDSAGKYHYHKSRYRVQEILDTNDPE